MTPPGGAELLVLFLLVFVLVPLVLVIWSVVDAARRSDAEFERAGQQRMLWIVLPLALMVAGVGWIASLVYFIVIRPKVVAAEGG